MPAFERILAAYEDGLHPRIDRIIEVTIDKGALVLTSRRQA